MVGHGDCPLFRRGEQSDHRRLDHRDQGHVRVGRHGYGPQQMGGELGGDVNGRGAVGRADDADGRRLLQVEAEEKGQAHGEENSCLGRDSEDKGHRVLEQGGEVDHGADGDEYQQGEHFVGNARVEKDAQGPVLEVVPRHLRQGR